MAIKAIIRAHTFSCSLPHSPHDNFDQLVDLIVSCGAEDLRKLPERAEKNTSYTLKIAVVEFIETTGFWAEESLKCHQ